MYTVLFHVHVCLFIKNNAGSDTCRTGLVCNATAITDAYHNEGLSTACTSMLYAQHQLRSTCRAWTFKVIRAVICICLQLSRLHCCYIFSEYLNKYDGV